jgi:ABC-type uncharacterized transport system permease subunit
VFVYAISVLEIVWTPDKVLLVLASIIGGAATFYEIGVFQTTLAF